MFGFDAYGEVSYGDARLLQLGKIQVDAGVFRVVGERLAFSVVLVPDPGVFVLIGYDVRLGAIWNYQVSLSGEATLECAPTTRFTEMIEQGDALVGYAIEISLRTLG
jgi:hypothetical protein